jgi:hypothetical protein
LKTHDTDWQGYRQRQRERIAPFLATHAPLADAYDALFDALLAEAPAAVTA